MKTFLAATAFALTLGLTWLVFRPQAPPAAAPVTSAPAPAAVIGGGAFAGRHYVICIKTDAVPWLWGGNSLDDRPWQEDGSVCHAREQDRRPFTCWHDGACEPE